MNFDDIVNNFSDNNVFIDHVFSIIFTSIVFTYFILPSRIFKIDKIKTDFFFSGNLLVIWKKLYRFHRLHWPFPKNVFHTIPGSRPVLEVTRGLHRKSRQRYLSRTPRSLVYEAIPVPTLLIGSI